MLRFKFLTSSIGDPADREQHGAYWRGRRPRIGGGIFLDGEWWSVCSIYDLAPSARSVGKMIVWFRKPLPPLT